MPRRNAVERSNFSLAHAPRPVANSLVIGKLELWLATRSSPTLPCHVRHIVCMSTDKKMVWLDTAAIVARVAHHHPCWNGPAIGKRPRETMNRFLTASNFQLAVAVAGYAPRPLHTAVRQNTAPSEEPNHQPHTSSNRFQCSPLLREPLTELAAHQLPHADVLLPVHRCDVAEGDDG